MGLIRQPFGEPLYDTSRRAGGGAAVDFTGL